MTKNFAINSATGGIGGKGKLATQVGLFASRQAIEVALDTAYDVGLNNAGARDALIVNTLGSLGGEALGRGLKAGFDRLWAKPKVVAPNNAAHNAAQFEKYKDSLRRAMSKPHATDPKLKQHLNELYRDNAKIGSGSTADAIRHELATGEAVGGVFHSQKGKDSITALQKWLKNNPNALPGDRAAAENVIIDIQNALGGN